MLYIDGTLVTKKIRPKQQQFKVGIFVSVDGTEVLSRHNVSWNIGTVCAFRKAATLHQIIL